MSALNGPVELAPAGSTGNNTHDPAQVSPTADKIAVQFVVEATGAGPTVTYELEGSLDGTNWFDLMLLPSDSETPALTDVVTTTGAYVSYLAQADVRAVRQVRLVTTLNTNVTYRAELYQQTTH